MGAGTRAGPQSGAAALREVDWVAEPGYSSAYVGKHENPATRAPLSEL